MPWINYVPAPKLQFRYNGGRKVESAVRDDQWPDPSHKYGMCELLVLFIPEPVTFKHVIYKVHIFLT